MLYGEIFERGMTKPRIVEGEASWVLSTNDKMNGAIAAFGAIRAKTWRMYHYSL
jgi:hypothetical protein